MPSLHDIEKEAVRIKYLRELCNYTNRNVIAYFSNWLSYDCFGDLYVNDNDLNGLMSAVYNLDRRKGLDLILHTPGGNPDATEAIVIYLRKMFGEDIRAIVPHLAMSAGTMLACSCKEIIMSKHSFLSPIDPQFGNNSAYDIVSEFDEAYIDIQSDPSMINYWSLRLGQAPLALYKMCQDAIALSSELAKEWLETNMLKNEIHKAGEVVDKLNEHDKSKTHGRHYDIETCKGFGLTVQALEDDPRLQDLVLSVHHSYMVLFSGAPIAKIIENHNGIGQITKGAVGILLNPAAPF